MRCAKSFALVMLGTCLACAAEPSAGGSRQSQTQAGTDPTAMADESPQGSGSADFSNTTFQASTTAGNAAPAPQAGGRRDCTGGLYLGSYDCELEALGATSQLTGDVSFALEINEMAADNECDVEFCPDLVIAEGTGTLFGLAVGWGFEAPLAGGLDCTTGEFRASAPDGVYGSAGSTDPFDPNALWTVTLPVGMFNGTLMGQHSADAPESISGEWDLMEPAAGYRCIGPFAVTLQP